MSKRRRRRREDRISGQYSGNLGNNIPFGINPTQLMSLLGNNIDLNQIGSMLSSMKTDGVDLNNFNLNQGNNNQGNNNQYNSMGFDYSPLQSIMSNLGFGNFNLSNNGSSTSTYENDISHTENSDTTGTGSYDTEIKEDINEEFFEDDENVQMLVAIKSIVDYKKSIFLDKVIDAYNKGLFK